MANAPHLRERLELVKLYILVANEAIVLVSIVNKFIT